ncbi:MAG: hypothetical protein WBA12_02570 [Catalinimonas sp.]
MAAPALARYIYEAYLALEAETGEKHEYHDGNVTAMAGGTPVHSLVASNCNPTVGSFYRTDGGLWQIDTARGRDATLTLDASKSSTASLTLKRARC